MDDDIPDADRDGPSPNDVAVRSASEVADYVADLTAELAKVTRGSGLDLLAYLLDIVHLEAKTTSRKVRTIVG